MGTKKIKIVLDADVIIHFAKGEMLATLPSILPECQFVVLDIVKSEIKRPLLTQLETQMQLLGNIQEVAFGDDFLWYAWKRGMMTVEEINVFVEKVTSAESNLPEDFDVEHYMPNTQM